MRSIPTCCQQKPLTAAPPAGSVPGGQVVVPVSLIARETKIWSRWSFLALAPSNSCHAIQGTGSAPAVVAPPATAGFSASRSVLMFSDGTWDPAVRSWPEGSQTLPAALKRLAKMLVSPPGRLSLGSYQLTQGVVRPAPAKSIDGASASFVGSRLSEAGKPWVTHWPPLKARTKICWASAPVRCSNAAQGTWTLPATTVPPAVSTTPALWLGSIELAGSSLTWAPLPGSGANAANAELARASEAIATAAAERRRSRGVTSGPSKVCGAWILSLPFGLASGLRGSEADTRGRGRGHRPCGAYSTGRKTREPRLGPGLFLSRRACGRLVSRRGRDRPRRRRSCSSHRRS